MPSGVFANRRATCRRSTSVGGFAAILILSRLLTHSSYEIHSCTRRTELSVSFSRGRAREVHRSSRRSQRPNSISLRMVWSSERRTETKPVNSRSRSRSAMALKAATRTMLLASVNFSTSTSTTSVALSFCRATAASYRILGVGSDKASTMSGT
jgi:hypothetical protein